MSIFRAIEAAYQKTAERKWDRVYWALDLHGTCIKSTYKQFTYEWIDDYYIKRAIQRLVEFPETHLILWSSVQEEEKPHIIKFFEDQGIRISGFNSNPMEPGNVTCNVAEKFYMSIIVDDKAGFCPTEWLAIPNFVDFHRKKAGFVSNEPLQQINTEAT
jgi:hypothetical protein